MINDLEGHYESTDKLFQIWSQFCYRNNFQNPIGCVLQKD